MKKNCMVGLSQDRPSEVEPFSSASCTAPRHRRVARWPATTVGAPKSVLIFARRDDCVDSLRSFCTNLCLFQALRIDPALDITYRDNDGSSVRIKWERSEGADAPDPAAAPATVSGEPSVGYPLGSRVLGRRQQAVTREPGDLPSVVVTREHVGRGVLAVAEPLVRLDRRGCFVRGDVPLCVAARGIQ
jgi:hypothetical protein